MIWGFWPGAWVWLITVKEDTWATERTVAALIHGAPIIPHIKLQTLTSTISKWKPLPFCNFRSFLAMISLRITTGRRLYYRKEPRADDDGLVSTHSLMWVSMNTRINMSMAGTMATNGTQGSMENFRPLGDINHPRACGSDGDRPSGTLSFSVYVVGLK